LIRNANALFRIAVRDALGPNWEIPRFVGAFPEITLIADIDDARDPYEHARDLVIHGIATVTVVED